MYIILHYTCIIPINVIYTNEIPVIFYSTINLTYNTFSMNFSEFVLRVVVDQS